MTTYSFSSMTVADLPMVVRWLATPAVREWWIDGEGLPADAITAEDLDDPRLAMWIVSREGKPFAFIQDYDPHAWADHHFAYLPAGSRGIDQFIGEPAMVGCGHGTALVRAHTETLLRHGAPAVGTDPNPVNGRAIRAYEKAGFTGCGERTTEWGHCLLMVRFSNPSEGYAQRPV